MLRNTFKYIRHARGIRYHSTNVKIGSPIQSKEELDQYLSSPSWSVEEFLNTSGTSESKRANSIDETTVKRLLELSGLEANEERYADLVSILKSQVVFIDHLHSIPDNEITDTSSIKPNLKALTLEDLEKSISTQQPSVEKGEVSDSWDPISLAKESLNGQYIVKEGLIKK